MDGRRFDTIARLVAGSRRSLLRSVLTAAIAGELLRTETNAKKKHGKRKGKRKNKNEPIPRACAHLGNLCYKDFFTSPNPCCAGEGICLKDRCCHSTGESCARDLDCCLLEELGVACEAGRCCAKPGGSCASGGPCCGNLPCMDNRCCWEPSTLAPSGNEGCLDDDYCCPGAVCGLRRVGLNRFCCRIDGSVFSCESDYECCSLTCWNGRCCTDGADPCDDTTECCGSMICGGFLDHPVCCYPHDAPCFEAPGELSSMCCDAGDVCLPPAEGGGPYTCRRPD
jgi:hypothetical protein